MADFKLRLALIQNSSRRQAVWSYTSTGDGTAQQEL